MILALLLACAEPASAPPPSPKVVVIVTDTLRADLGGAEWPTWAEGGRRYLNAFSAAPYTTASTATLATGRYPQGLERQHPAGPAGPACRGDHKEDLTRGTWPADAWPDKVLTDQPVVQMQLGQPVGTWGKHGSPALVAEAVAALGSSLLSYYFHTLGAHVPYMGRSRAGTTTPDRRYVEASHCGEDLPPDMAGWARWSYWATTEQVLADLEPLVTAARAAGAVVIWTSDHGEALGEDGLWGHGTSLHDAQVRVPLVVWGPGVDPYVDDRPVPATCVGQTARVALGDNTPGLCDLRDGTITGKIEVGISRPDGTWDERVILSPALAAAP